MKIGNHTLLLGDTFDHMREIPDESVDMVLCDLPYGTTRNKWDAVIPFVPLWEEYWRACKSNAAVVLTAQAPFDKMLGASQIEHLKYEWIWQKEAGTGFLNVKKQPPKDHENVLVFYRETCVYNPQFDIGTPYSQVNGRLSENYGKRQQVTTENDGRRYPKTVRRFAREKGFHPTQKPVALFEYLTRTYTNEGETVLDNTAGSMTTAVAAEQCGRKSICIERDAGYFMKAMHRVSQAVHS